MRQFLLRFNINKYPNVKVLNIIAILILIGSLSVLVYIKSSAHNIQNSLTETSFNKTSKYIEIFFVKSINNNIYKKSDIILVKHNLTILPSATVDAIPLENTIHIFTKYTDFMKLLIKLYRHKMLGTIQSLEISPAKKPGTIEVKMVSTHHVKFRGDK